MEKDKKMTPKEKEIIEEIEREILEEINHRQLNDMCGYGISIKENDKRTKRGEPVELSKWIKWYFKRLKGKQI